MSLLISDRSHALGRWANGFAAVFFEICISMECMQGDEYDPYYEDVLDYYERCEIMDMEAELAKYFNDLRKTIGKYREMYGRCPNVMGVSGGEEN